MKHLKKLPLQGEWIARLFAKFQARYGHKWTSSQTSGELVKLAAAEWAEGLSGYTSDDIARGLDIWREDWPPSLPEFQKACRPIEKACHQEHKALPKPEPDKELGQKFLNHAHTVLKNSEQHSAKDTGGTPSGDRTGIPGNAETDRPNVWATELGKRELQRLAALQTEGGDGKTTTDRNSGDQE